MAASILVAWLVMVPSGWFFGVHLGLGPSGAWAGILLEVASLAVVMSWRFWHSPKLAAADMPAAGVAPADEPVVVDEAQAVKAAA
jgi:MATE family multidrug resistance protein